MTSTRWPRTRPFWKTLPRQVALTAFLMLGLAAALLALVLTGPLAESIGEQIGLGDTFLTVFSIVKWPVLAAVVSILFAVLLHEGPNVNVPYRELVPGAFLATFLWLLASIAFAFYVANFGSYASTYGSIAGIIIFLVWMWISNLSLLVGRDLQRRALPKRHADHRGRVDGRRRAGPATTRRDGDLARHRLGDRLYVALVGAATASDHVQVR